MAVVIRSAKIDSFRGVNTERTVKFSQGVTLIHGLNGMGKTTILQAIEWCLTGEIPSFEGPDFKEEDAIVNCFTDKKSASVILTLEDTTSNRIMTVDRRRRRSKSSGTTKTNTSLKVVVDGKEQENDSAMEILSQFLGVGPEDLAKNTYIRQDAIDQLLHEKPEDRSRALDVILGTDKIRGFLDAINVSTSRTRNSLKEKIEGIEIGRVQIATALQEEAEETKNQLLAGGMRKEDLNLQQAVKSAGSLFDKMASLAAAVGARPPAKAAIPADPSELYESLEKYAKDADEIDRTRQEVHSQKSDQIAKISALISSLQGLREGLQQYSGKDVSSLRRRLVETENELRGIAEERTAISREIARLGSNSRAIDNALRDYENAKLQLDQVAGGQDVQALKKEEAELEERHSSNLVQQNQARARVESLGKTFEELDRLVTSYRSVVEQISSLGFDSADGRGTQQTESLEASIEEMRSKSKEAGEGQVRLAGLVSELRTSNSTITSARRTAEELEVKISASIQKFGDTEARTKLREQKSSSLQEIKQSLDSFNTYDSLVGKAMEYIRTARPPNCPVCERPSEPDQLLALLNSKVKGDIAKKIQDLSAKAKQESEYVAELTKDTDALLGYRRDLEVQKTRIVAELSRLSTLLGVKVNADFDFEGKIKEVSKDAESARNLAMELGGQVQKSEIRLAEFKRLLQNRQSAEEKIHTLLRTRGINLGTGSLDAECSTILEGIAKERQQANRDLDQLLSSANEVFAKLTTVRSKVAEIGRASAHVKSAGEVLAGRLAADASTSGEVLIGMAKEAIELDNREVESLTAKDRNLEERKTAKTSEANQIRNDLDNMAKLIESKTRAERDLQSLLKSSEVDERLLQKANEELQALKALAEKYSSSGQYAREISEVKKAYKELIAGPVTFLVQEKKAEEAIEKENALSRKKEALEANMRALEALEGSLQAIRETANSYLQNEVQNVIRSHGEQIDAIYNRIVRHPAFQHIEVEVDTNGPTTYSIKVKDSNGEITTSAPVRFSTAQLNSFAISIMVANSMKAGLPFAVLMMDDPTQSMDGPHKEYLAELISDLMKDKQMIIVTSDIEFKSLVQERCKGNLQDIELRGWTKDGPEIVARTI
jgi:exonuclease SbcC